MYFQEFLLHFKMKEKQFSTDLRNNTKEESSQNNYKPRIFLIKKIKAKAILSSPYLFPFQLLPRIGNISNNNDDDNKINILNNNNSVENILNLFDINKIISEIINNQGNDIKLSCCQKYNYFKKYLNIKSQKRKTKIDCILKKCKSNLSKAFDGILYKLLKIRGKSYKLPQNFVTNINIMYNRKYLFCSMLKIFEDYKIILDIDTLKKQLSVNKFKLFLYIVNKKLIKIWFKNILVRINLSKIVEQ